MALDVFLKLEKIEGESLDARHKDEIDVLSWSWGVSNSGPAQIAGGRKAARPRVQDLAVTKYVDRASVSLLHRSFTGQMIGTATLSVVDRGRVTIELLVLEFEDVIVTSVSTGGSDGEDRLAESITLNFAKVTQTYTRFDEKGERADGDSVVLDVKANVVS